MKIVYRWLKSTLGGAMLVLLASCATHPYIPTDSTVQNMSVKQARHVLIVRLKGAEFYKYNGSIADIAYLTDTAMMTSVRVTSNRLIVTDGQGKQTTFIFKELPEIIAQPFNALRDDIHSVELSTQPKVLTFISGGNDRANDIANALYVLKQNAIKTKKEAAEYDARFTESLADYRKKTAVNAALPEEANRYKVQADGAVRDKQFDAAADFYAEALKIAPWWPTGHFNRALVLGETSDYELAVREMKRYLLLVPNASNARAAQDRIYVWERKAGEEN